MNGKYDVRREYINISDYSPFCHINEVSPQYHSLEFMLPFVSRYSEKRPVHPDTFMDMGLDSKEIVEEKIAYPTSSLRTLYCPEDEVFYKLPILRKITRGLRNLPKKELMRSEKAGEILSGLHFEGFNFLREECHYADDENFNYIRRDLPVTETFPWFYIIKNHGFDADFEMACIENIIKTWMFFASNDVFLEYHTQNILVDGGSNIYYRDLSDIRSSKEPILRSSYFSSMSGVGELLSAIFDRTVCKQNLDHFFRYDTKVCAPGKIKIKKLIESEIEKYSLPFPDYSMDFPKDSPERIPQRTELTYWRKFDYDLSNA